MTELEKRLLQRVEELKKENEAMRNELCCQCGKYKTAHLGSCNGCRWKEG